MYKLCKSEQSAIRQRELEHLLLSIMNTTRYEDISVSDFCAQAGIPRKAFYRYFSSKDGALHALIDHTLLEVESFPSTLWLGSSKSQQKELVRFFRFWQKQKPLLDALEKSGISGVLVTRTIDYVLSDVGAADKAPAGNMLVRQYATTFGVCGFMSMVLSWHQNGYETTPEEMAQIASIMLTAPLIRQKESATKEVLQWNPKSKI